VYVCAKVTHLIWICSFFKHEIHCGSRIASVNLVVKFIESIEIASISRIAQNT
jgi:hypothetical protein